MIGWIILACVIAAVVILLTLLIRAERRETERELPKGRHRVGY